MKWVGGHSDLIAVGFLHGLVDVSQQKRVVVPSFSSHMVMVRICTFKLPPQSGAITGSLEIVDARFQVIGVIRPWDREFRWRRLRRRRWGEKRPPPCAARK